MPKTLEQRLAEEDISANPPQPKKPNLIPYFANEEISMPFGHWDEGQQLDKRVPQKTLKEWLKRKPRPLAIRKDGIKEEFDKDKD